MKKQILVGMVMAAALLGLSSCEVDGYVTDQPAEVVYTRPVAPGSDYIWIDGDWVWSGGAYVWHEGYWGRSREGHVWVRGNWARTDRGYRWNRGHWRK